MDDEVLSFGWRCAQKRPLRALAHVLSLFEPNFVFLGDDDTYVNYPLMREFVDFLNSPSMRDQPVSFGNLCGEYVTVDGCYNGGVGYIFGKKTLEQLTTKRIIKSVTVSVGERSVEGNLFAHSRPIETKRRFEVLSLYSALKHEDELRRAGGGGDGAQACVVESERSGGGGWGTWWPGKRWAGYSYMSSFWQNMCGQVSYHFRGGVGNEGGLVYHYVPVRIPAVDLCASALSGDHTCLHSDHSITQCLAYGIGADLRGCKCECQSYEDIARKLGASLSLTNKTEKGLFQTRLMALMSRQPQMCHARALLPCDVRVHMTCHRHRPVSLTDHNPVQFRPD